jgi:hypothetical protein
MWTTWGASTEHQPLPFLLPHELFARVLSEATGPEKILGEELTLEEYWKEQEHCDWAKDQDFLQPGSEEQRKWAVPLGVHGDDAASKSGKLKMLVISWSGLLARSSGKDVRFPITCFPLHRAIPDVTVRAILEIVAWSFKVLRTGLHPRVDHTSSEFIGSARADKARKERAGSPLAKGYFGVFADSRGDWKWHVEAYGLTCTYRHNSICHMCSTKKPGTCDIFFASFWPYHHWSML